MQTLECLPSYCHYADEISPEKSLRPRHSEGVNHVSIFFFSQFTAQVYKVKDMMLVFKNGHFYPFYKNAIPSPR